MQIQIGLLGVGFLTSRAVVVPHFLEIAVEAMAMQFTIYLNMWLLVSKGMLPVKTLTPAILSCDSQFLSTIFFELLGAPDYEVHYLLTHYLRSIFIHIAHRLIRPI